MRIFEQCAAAARRLFRATGRKSDRTGLCDSRDQILRVRRLDRCHHLLSWAGAAVAIGRSFTRNCPRGGPKHHCLRAAGRGIHVYLSGDMTTEMPSTDTENMPIIEMTGVRVGSLHEPGPTVLEDVTWRVEACDYWLVAGMQGSGKSDFMAMTGGLMPPLAGSYRLFGQAMPIYEDKLLSERLRLGLVFDGGHLLHQLTVAENLALPLQYHHNFNRDEAANR